MANYQAISIERHAKQSWQRHSNYFFAAADAVIALTAAELPKATMSLPLAFIERGAAFAPAALLGLQAGRNLFVAPDGRWAASYIPAALRAYPFRLVATTDGQRVLCIDEDSEFFTAGPGGERFFNDDAQPAPTVLDILDFLRQTEQSRLATEAACAVLQKHQLIRPWTITVKTDTGDQQIAGLFQIDEAALNQLSAEALHEVRQAGALPMAYCQLLSMQHLPLLGELAAAHARHAAQLQAAGQVAPKDEKDEKGAFDLASFSNNGTISFAGLL